MHVCVCVRVCLCLYVCVCTKERGTEREKERKREPESVHKVGSPDSGVELVVSKCVRFNLCLSQYMHVRM